MKLYFKKICKKKAEMQKKRCNKKAGGVYNIHPMPFLSFIFKISTKKACTLKRYTVKNRQKRQKVKKELKIRLERCIVYI